MENQELLNPGILFQKLKNSDSNVDSSLFGLEIHIAIPRRELDSKSRTIGSDCSGAHWDNLLAQCNMHLLSIYCVQGIDQALPQCAGMKTIFTDEHTETACSVSFAQRGRFLIIACCLESREVIWQHSHLSWKIM